MLGWDRQRQRGNGPKVAGARLVNAAMMREAHCKALKLAVRCWATASCRGRVTAALAGVPGLRQLTRPFQHFKASGATRALTHFDTPASCLELEVSCRRKQAGDPP